VRDVEAIDVKAPVSGRPKRGAGTEGVSNAGDTPTRTPKPFIEDPSRNLTATRIPSTTERRGGKSRMTRGPPAPDVLAGIEPAFVSVKFAAAFVAESPWAIKDKLRRGILRARKAGRRTLVEFQSLRDYAASLPTATFAPPRPRTKTHNATA
jgi:hypothetical protein